jgi:hypothetical protein
MQITLTFWEYSNAAAEGDFGNISALEICQNRNEK